MYRIFQTVRSTHNQDGAIVLDTQRGEMFKLNLVGSRILELLKAGTGEPAIVDTISKEFGVSRDPVARDVQEFLGALETCHLVDKQDSAVTI
jgi:Coenzyme PQQ synthesis protein D (PqqD)